ncbi:MAG: hypothetical protein LAT83_23870, partial [Kiritimatiellae bacterium]|nr:hypothetical protein [Kiritimatiellia bacterium]
MAPELRQREFDSAPPPHYPPLPPVGPSAQSLLIPESISFDPEDAATLRERLAEIQALGFHIEPFGGDTFLVEAIPAWMNDISAEPVIRNLARSMESGAGKPATSKELRDAMARSCCRMAAEMR